MTFHLKRLIFAGLLATAPLHAADIPSHIATKPVPRPDQDGQDRHAALCELTRKQADARVVFLGDSITQLWEADEAGIDVWKKYWVPLKAANFGCSGDRTEHVLWRLENGNLDGMKPKLIVLMIGTNNAGQQYEEDAYTCTAAQTADGIRAIIEKLKGKCPGSSILLLGIFPRGEENTDRVRVQNEATNAIIKDYADNKTVYYMDIGEKFLKPNGDGDITVMNDMLHLSPKGYGIWTRAIMPKVKQLLQ